MGAPAVLPVLNRINSDDLVRDPEVQQVAADADSDSPSIRRHDGDKPNDGILGRSEVAALKSQVSEAAANNDTYATKVTNAMRAAVLGGRKSATTPIFSQLTVSTLTKGASDAMNELAATYGLPPVGCSTHPGCGETVLTQADVAKALDIIYSTPQLKAAVASGAQKAAAGDNFTVAEQGILHYKAVADLMGVPTPSFPIKGSPFRTGEYAVKDGNSHTPKSIVVGHDGSVHAKLEGGQSRQLHAQGDGFCHDARVSDDNSITAWTFDATSGRLTTYWGDYVNGTADWQDHKVCHVNPRRTI